MKIWLISIIALGSHFYATCDNKWYTQGDFAPSERVSYTLTNNLNVDRENSPVVIRREEFPIPDLHEMWVTVVDPTLPSAPQPTAKQLQIQGGHEMRAETNGHAIFHQLDDLDKDGIWDELFFQTNLKAGESKTIYIYLGENIRGWNRHYTHVNVGSYCRHQMPFWESEYIGWKIWFANSVDVYAKRKPGLVSPMLYMDNLDGYGISQLNHDYGSDIQSVAGSMGGGAICLFENKDNPAEISMPRFTPVQKAQAAGSLWNAGQISDTRYAYEVVVNGPVRSIIKIKGMNWNSGHGSYAYEQYYTVYAHQSYCTSQVRFTTFMPKKSGVMMGCGVYKKPKEDNFIEEKGLLVTSGSEAIRDPENIDSRKEYIVPFIGSAMIVKEKYLPVYQFVNSNKGNHTYRITPDVNNTYEYMLIGGWSEGSILRNKEEFNSYARKTHQEYNNPLISQMVAIEHK